MDLVELKNPLQNRHPWEQARLAFFRSLIASAAGRGRPLRVLDVGCGDAWFARRVLEALPASSTLVGWDIHLSDDLIEAFSADLPAGMTLTRAEPSGRFDLVLCMDVLEHVADDRGFLADLCGRFLNVGGHFLCSVPAGPGLFSRHDLELRHYRRYTPWQGAALVRSEGLEVVRKGGLFHGLAAVRRLQLARWGKAEPLADPATYLDPNAETGLGGWDKPAAVTGLIVGALRAEGAFSRAASAAGLEIPGLSWWALCRKP